MPYSFNPFTGKLSVVNPTAAALNVLGTVANPASLPGGATTGDVYQTLDTNDFYVWDGAAWDNLGDLAGPAGATGATGATGPAGADGVGVPVGGTAGQALTKIDGTDYNTEWSDVSAVGALNDLTDVNVPTPTNNHVLTYDSTAGEWISAAPSGGGGGTPGGSDTQIQYNDGGSFGGATKLLYDDTASAEKLTLDSADLELNDGGSFTTSVQAITATAARTISFPDATGTVGLVPGADTQIVYNDNGALGATADLTLDATTGVTYTPTWNNGATTFSALTVDVTNTLSAAASTLLDLKVGGTSSLSVSPAGQVLVPNGTLSNPSYGFSANPDCGFYIRSTNQIGTVVDGALKHETNGNELTLFSIPIAFAPNTSSASDLRLLRDDANTLAQRSGW